jgi:hypothetical protein
MFERVMVENYGFEFRRNGGDNTLSQHLKFNEMLEDGLRVTGEELYGLEDLRSDSYCDISQFEVRYMFQHYNGFKWPDKNMELEIFCQSLVHDLSKSQELSEEGTRLRYGNIESALNSISTNFVQVGTQYKRSSVTLACSLDTLKLDVED